MPQTKRNEQKVGEKRGEMKRKEEAGLNSPENLKGRENRSGPESLRDPENLKVPGSLKGPRSGRDRK